jgi:hypothetical protein
MPKSKFFQKNAKNRLTGDFGGGKIKICRDLERKGPGSWRKVKKKRSKTAGTLCAIAPKIFVKLC